MQIPLPRGSVPEMVMRAGVIRPYSPYDARRDIRQNDVETAVRVPVGLQPGTVPGPISGAFGTDAQGRPTREFTFPTVASVEVAHESARALRGLAKWAKRLDASVRGMVKEVIAPSAAPIVEHLARGGTAVLRWKNGVAVSLRA